jgi:hypothetical protein
MNKSSRIIVLVMMLSACVVSRTVAQDRRPLAVPASGFIQQGATAKVETPWEKFAPEGGGFAVLLPGKPTGSEQAVESKVGTLKHHMFLLVSGTDVYMVSYVDYPDPVTDPAVIKTMLDAGREGGLQATHGELKSEKEIKLGEYTGREWVVNIPDAGFARARAYWVSSRLYQAMVVLGDAKTIEAEKVRDATMAKFLDSFVLTAK